ncbi:MAG: hypothetical protein M3Z17_04145 [Gemmatimonadota bacterium]|nr:hypothetical protein [Gemmatimonadota bacterium]
MTTPEFITRWTARRDELRRLSALVDGATLLDEVLGDLENVAAPDPLLSLTAAASVTGYTPDHLARLIRGGSLTNHGRKGSPRVKLCECPKKARLATGIARAYDVRADARSLGARR